MIVEQAMITVAEGKEESFESAFAEAKSVMASSPGCQSVHLYRCVEDSERFMLFVEWDSVEAHEENFRGTERFRTWRAAIGPFFASPPHVEHFLEV